MWQPSELEHMPRPYHIGWYVAVPLLVSVAISSVAWLLGYRSGQEAIGQTPELFSVLMIMAVTAKVAEMAMYKLDVTHPAFGTFSIVAGAFYVLTLLTQFVFGPLLSVSLEPTLPGWLFIASGAITVMIVISRKKNPS